ncbi:hypothetical protein [Nocardiopsis sp. YSL2]|uniref:hypothetical protein n=1 Tax=Nocardiopsis sp. YSL2 TaxID=2939492 RepID=UPI0026F461BB|nr:hypothetical protein [Nocardiopsis sp. YSL2]
METSPEPERPVGPRERWLLAAIVGLVFAGLVVLRITSWGGLDQTALFYLGLPATIALLIVFTARPRTGVGAAMAVTALVLAMAGPLLAEGMVCLLLAAPLIFGVVALVAALCSAIARGASGSRHALLFVPVLFVLTLEGVGGTTILPRQDQGTGERVIDAPPSQVAAALAAPPEYGAFEALFLRAVPFPEPVRATGEGLDVGDTRVVHFTPRTTLAIGDEPTPRRMELVVVESNVGPDGGRVVFDVVEDTAFSGWMDMRRAEAAWSAADGGTRLGWAIDYERTYEPSWYFGPLQAYATDLAAEYLAATFETTATEEAR